MQSSIRCKAETAGLRTTNLIFLFLSIKNN
jgi:hypothetical protein